jgi:hypothetical protein
MERNCDGGFNKRSLSGSSQHQSLNVSTIHCKERLAISPSPAGMLLTKLSLAAAGNNLIIPAEESLFSDFPAGDGKIVAFFTVYLRKSLSHLT